MTEYLTGTANNMLNGERLHVGVQSNSDNIETQGGTRLNTSTVSPEVPKVTMHETKKQSDLSHLESQTSGIHKAKTNIATAVKFPREGKTVPAVDFMDMNKEVINFATQQRNSQVINAGDGKFDQSTQEEAKEGSSPTAKKFSQPKLKQSGAFRHTEYAKGFYKVNGVSPTTAGYQTIANDTASRQSIVAGETTGFSEIERSVVLDNQSRKPIGSKLLNSTKQAATTKQVRNVVPVKSPGSDVSRFNSTQDTAWFKPGHKNSVSTKMAKNGKYRSNGKSMSPRDASAAGHFDGGVQTVDPMISFGRAIGPGGSLQPRPYDNSN